MESSTTCTALNTDALQGKIKAGATINKYNCNSQLNQAFNIYVCQTLLQHHAQTIPPDIMDDYLGKMDDMIEKSASAATGIDYANVDEITRTRLRLPRRMYGGALRRQQLIAEMRVCVVVVIGGCGEGSDSGVRLGTVFKRARHKELARPREALLKRRDMNEVSLITTRLGHE